MQKVLKRIIHNIPRKGPVFEHVGIGERGYTRELCIGENRHSLEYTLSGVVYTKEYTRECEWASEYTRESGYE